MFEIARYLEQMAVRFNPVLLIGPGLVAVLLGLFVWLGGLGFRRVLFAILGAVSGGACGFFITAQSGWLAVILACVAALIAIMFEKVFIIILAAALAVVFCFAVLVGPCVESGRIVASAGGDKTENRAELSIRQSKKIMGEYIAGSVTEIKQLLFNMPVHKLAIIAVLAVVCIAAGSYLWRLTSAFCCAALGTSLIFAGMILLLLYKGAAPVSRILQNHSFYLGVFAVMTGFGMAEQLLLCPGVKRKSADEKKTDEKKKEPEKSTEGWRNR